MKCMAYVFYEDKIETNHPGLEETIEQILHPVKSFEQTTLASVTETKKSLEPFELANEERMESLQSAFIKSLSFLANMNQIFKIEEIFESH